VFRPLSEASQANELHGYFSMEPQEVANADHSNQQYSITAVTTSAGAIAERYAYSAYGEPTILDASGSVIANSTINNRYSYTGREWDATVGLHHFRARWMSPKTGRFLGRDPIGFRGGKLLYGFYCFLSLLDPSGNQTGGASNPQYPQPTNPLQPMWPVPNPENPLGPYIPPNDPKITGAGPKNPFNSLKSLLYSMCSDCCGRNECTCDDDADKIVQKLNEIWNQNYNEGPHAHPGIGVWIGQWWEGIIVMTGHQCLPMVFPA
jgi:RHS repeat-associated protein